MSPARIAAASLLLFLSGALVSASGGDYPRENASLDIAVVFPPPDMVPNYAAFTMPMLRELARSPSRKSAPRTFSFAAEGAEPGASPAQPARRKFSFPRVIVDRRHSDDVCYTAQSYLYARESRHSDVTRRVGYRECTPATKFEMKSADLPR